MFMMTSKTLLKSLAESGMAVSEVFTEAANIENALFGEERLQNVLNENRDGSPEQLNDYIRVSNPGVWLVLAAVIVLLIGVCVWGIFGRLETTVGSAAVVKDGEMTLYVKEEYLGKITE